MLVLVYDNCIVFLLNISGPPIIETVSQNSSALPNSSGINKKVTFFVIIINKNYELFIMYGILIFKTTFT